MTFAFKTIFRVLGTQGIPWFFSWDTNNFYFAADDSAVSSNDPGIFILLHLSTSPVSNISSGFGSFSGATFVDQTPKLSFPSNFFVLWKGDDTFSQIFSFNGKL